MAKYHPNSQLKINFGRKSTSQGSYFRDDLQSSQHRSRQLPRKRHWSWEVERTQSHLWKHSIFPLPSIQKKGHSFDIGNKSDAPSLFKCLDVQRSRKKQKQHLRFYSRQQKGPTAELSQTSISQSQSPDEMFLKNKAHRAIFKFESKQNKGTLGLSVLRATKTKTKPPAAAEKYRPQNVKL